MLLKTLAKTLTYIGYHAPGEFGLFWDEDGTMPWKEFYWALQQDPELRFVREATLRELGFLGCDLPFELDAKRLRIRPGATVLHYPPIEPPKRLYYGCSRRSLGPVREHGLVAAARQYLALAANRDLAEAIARRRDPEPVMIDVMAAEAGQEGIAFRHAGADLYLVTALPSRFLVFPMLPQDKLAELDKAKSKPMKKRVAEPATPAGSFVVHPWHLQESAQKEEGTRKGGKKGGKGSDWKREGRRLRGKRSV